MGEGVNLGSEIQERFSVNQEWQSRYWRAGISGTQVGCTKLWSQDRESANHQRGALTLDSATGSVALWRSLVGWSQNRVSLVAFVWQAGVAVSSFPFIWDQGWEARG